MMAGMEVDMVAVVWEGLTAVGATAREVAAGGSTVVEMGMVTQVEWLVEGRVEVVVVVRVVEAAEATAEVAEVARSEGSGLVVARVVAV